MLSFAKVLYDSLIFHLHFLRDRFSFFFFFFFGKKMIIIKRLHDIMATKKRLVI